MSLPHQRNTRQRTSVIRSMTSSPQRGNPIPGKANNRGLPTLTSNPVNCGPAVEQVNPFWQEQGRQAEQYQQERFETTARHYEAGARDELHFATARVNVESQYQHGCETTSLRNPRRVQIFSASDVLISHFASEEKQTLESERDNLINEASMELSRRREQAPHLQAEVQLQAAYCD